MDLFSQDYLAGALVDYQLRSRKLIQDLELFMITTRQGDEQVLEAVKVSIEALKGSQRAVDTLLEAFLST